jgi:hypothetical protein
MKLNLGSGSLKLKDYMNIDIKDGKPAYPLDVLDGSCDEIRASHVLEHFSHRETRDVVNNWVSKLKDGGVLKIAVPDFDKICKLYSDKSDEKIGFYLMGGQVDDDDYHKSAFDEDSLTTIMESAGITDIKVWKSEIEDCASLPISLNLSGTKTKKQSVSRKISAIMSMPRLTFTDTFTCVMRHIVAKGIPFNRSSGVFWGQCLTRMIELEMKKDLDYVLTIDYDSWFTYDDIIRLVQLLEAHPEYDAVMPVQIKRENEGPMIGAESPTGDDKIPITYFNDEIVPANTGHFGLTVFRKNCFEKIKKPWFIPEPDKDGGWEDGRIDEDIMFWHNFKEAGCKLGVATNVRIGHLQLKVTYPGPKSGGWKPVDVQVSDVEKGQVPDVLKSN